MRSLYRRRFCLDCSPFGTHNTSRQPWGALSDAELKEARRKRRNGKTYRHQKKRRKSVKRRLVELLGGRCKDCGYDGTPNALEFHHLDASTKEFTISRRIAQVSLERVLLEAQKCVLLCANCHRFRHTSDRPIRQDAVIALVREARKAEAVLLMGRSCQGCGLPGPNELFEFHHRKAEDKAFGISEDGIMRDWSKVLAELAKCVMLCANCHREVHAGVRVLDGGPLGLAEDALPYVA